MTTTDTIYALATPMGKSGVAVIRLSGGKAKAIAEEMTGVLPKPRFAYFRSLVDGEGRELDQALALYFAAPASFTGEDVVELQVHGGRAIIRAVMDRIQTLGARPSEPGEFTRRALENGKLDMLQVEALGDFIDADTELQRQQSMRGLRGEAGEWTMALRDQLVEAMSLVTASIDFSDEDLPESLIKSIGYAISEVKSTLERELAKIQRSRGLRDGFKVAIIGKPNVGKSSLINALAGREIAIETDVAGTTRDVLEVFLDLGGLPVLMYDTAGLRETDDQVEAIGIDRARKTAENADLRIFLYEEALEIDELGVQPRNDDFIVQSKADLHGDAGFVVSAKTGLGLNELLDRIQNHFAEQSLDFGYFNNSRQLNTLEQAKTSLEDAEMLYSQGESVYELLAESLRQAVFSLDLLVGKVDVEDMLDVIFSKFCIGK